GMVSGGVACGLALLVHAAIDGVGIAAPYLAQPAAWTIPLAVVVTVVVSVLDPRGPSPRTDRFLARVHTPERG
ncbi:MAG: cation acetate symporter, partial [Microbacterium sp.]|nr:cation acetate symporter [Microbacterium sp.]